MSVVGRWRIVATELWDSDALNLVAPAFIEFGEDGLGSFGFIAVQGELDCRDVTRDGRPGVEFLRIPGKGALGYTQPRLYRSALNLICVHRWQRW